MRIKSIRKIKGFVITVLLHYTKEFHPDSALDAVIKNLHETYQCRM